MNTHIPQALSLGILLFCGCYDASSDGSAVETPASQSRAARESAPTKEAAASRSLKDQALAAKQVLFEELSGELVAAMSSRGPAEAIKVCSEKAPDIATRVSRKHGLKIGRTSFKLRNPKNTPPEWTTEFIERRESEPQFVDIDDHTLGALLPIKLMPQCLMCHGPDDQIEPTVKAALDELYPDDNATGFNLGDLRGWFWIEVPAQANPEEAAGEDETTGLIQCGEIHEAIGQQQHQGRVSPT